MREPCGCENITDPCGVLRNVSKCQAHALMSGGGGASYYLEQLGCVVNGIPQHRLFTKQITEALGSVGVTIPQSHGGRVLEIGAGMGMYAPLFQSLGYRYEGIEPDPFAAEWTASTFCVPVFSGTFEEYRSTEPFDAIIAAHVIEHLKDAPAGIARMFDMLKPGGALYIVVPDDTDLMNPDHLWFFNEGTLRTILERTGFWRVRMASRKVIARENFIYCAAVRP